MFKTSFNHPQNFMSFLLLIILLILLLFYLNFIKIANLGVTNHGPQTEVIKHGKKNNPNLLATFSAYNLISSFSSIIHLNIKTFLSLCQPKCTEQRQQNPKPSLPLPPPSSVDLSGTLFFFKAPYIKTYSRLQLSVHWLFHMCQILRNSSVECAESRN